MIESAYPINRNYFGQGTEQSLALNLIGQVSLRSLFGLNCLFFDQLAISAPDLLGNPVLYELFNQEAQEMSLLYRRRSEGGIGLIQPVLAGDFDSTGRSSRKHCAQRHHFYSS